MIPQGIDCQVLLVGDAFTLLGRIPMSELIRDAIQRRLMIVLNYKPGERLIEPHAYGKSKEGKFLLRAFQVSGASHSNEHVNWKLFRIDRMASLSLSAQTFSGPRPDYNPDDKAMKGGVIARL
jgi:hypothetical protein